MHNKQRIFLLYARCVALLFWLFAMESHQKLAHCICTTHHNSMSHYAVKLFNPLFSLSRSLSVQVLFVPITSLLLTFHSLSCSFCFVSFAFVVHPFFLSRYFIHFFSQLFVLHTRKTYTYIEKLHCFAFVCF